MSDPNGAAKGVGWLIVLVSTVAAMMGLATNPNNPPEYNPPKAQISVRKTPSKLEGTIQEFAKIQDLNNDGKEDIVIDTKVGTTYDFVSLYYENPQNRDVFLKYGNIYFQLKLNEQGKLLVTPYEIPL